ncbi:MAG: hypothetical protein ACFB51_16585 [Anaerolineae bacterium]
MVKPLKTVLSLGLLALVAGLLTQTAYAANVGIVLDSAGNVGEATAMVLTASGSPVIAYYDRTNGDQKLAVCDTPACVNPAISAEATQGNAGEVVSIALQSEDAPVIPYYSDFSQRIRMVMCDNPGCFGAVYRDISPFQASSPESAVVVTSADIPLVAYHNTSDNSLWLAICSNFACPSVTPVQVSPPGDGGRYMSMVLNGSGYPVLSYRAAAGGVKLAVCADATCSSATITAIDAVGGEDTSLALDSAGNPVVSHYDPVTDDLRLIVCDNPICTSRSVTTVESTGDVGNDASLALDSGDNPMISYYDGTNGDLKLAVCNDPTCTNPAITVIDSAGDVGQYSSLVKDGSDTPFISYYDATNGDLKLFSLQPPPIPNPDFDTDLTEWTLLANGGGDQQLCPTGDCAVILSGSGGTEAIRIELPTPFIPDTDWALSFEIGGYAIPAEGFIGARLEFLEGDATVATANCLAPERGTFNATTVTCPPAAAPSSYDAIRISIGWQNISGGLLFIDDVALDVTN